MFTQQGAELYEEDVDGPTPSRAEKWTRRFIVFGIGAIFVAVFGGLAWLVITNSKHAAKQDREDKTLAALDARNFETAKTSVKRLGLDVEFNYENAYSGIVTVGRCSRSYNIDWNTDFSVPTFTRRLDNNTTLRLKASELLADLPADCQPSPG